MRVKIAQNSRVILQNGEVYEEGSILDIEESVGEALVAGGSATSVIEYRPEALTQ